MYKNFRLFILFIFYYLAKFSTKIFSFYRLRFDLVTVPAVNTYGDPINHYDLIRLKSILEKKKYLIISTNSFPSNYLLPFLFKKKNYYFYNEIFYLFICRLISIYKKKNLIKIFDHLILESLLKRFSKFNMYKIYNQNEDYFLLKNKFFFNRSAINAYIKLRKNDNKFENIKYLFQLRKNISYINLKKCIGYKEENWKILKERLKLSDNFICLHIRNTNISNTKLSYSDERTVHDISSYKILINYLIKIKYQIVILGSSSDSSITNQLLSDSVINYKFSEYQNLENDILLMNNCRFFVGNFSGPSSLASAFNVPMLIFDGLPLWDYWKYTKIRVYPKIIFNKKNNKIVKFNKLIFHKNFFNYESLQTSNWASKLVSAQDKMIELKFFLRDLSYNKIIKNTIYHKKAKSILNEMHLGLFDNYLCLSSRYLKKVI
jgi:hypothetical protein